jgi:hypothetical protein
VGGYGVRGVEAADCEHAKGQDATAYDYTAATGYFVCEEESGDGDAEHEDGGEA